MSDEVFFSKMVTKGLEPIESDGRFFEGYLTVQVKDKQGEVTIVDELYKVLPIWMDRGAPITDTHSNRVIGKGINFARSDYTDVNGDIYPAIKVTGKIYKDYELDNEIWSKIKSGEYKGLSFGGSTKTDREPMRMKDGSIAYSLSKLEHYEVAVCKDPAVPLAVITDINPIAKSNMACDKTGCYVTKPVLGKPNFESAVRNVMEESDVPRKNAERIVGAAENKKADDVIIPEQSLNLCKHCGLPKKSEGANEPEYHDESIIKGKQVKERKKRKKQGQGMGNKRSWRAFKSLVDTNKILNLYQGNLLPLARLLDKDAPKDINLAPSGNIPKKREPKGQSHGAQSTRERERGIIEQQADPKLHYTTPHSMDRNRVTAPNEYLDEDQHDFFDDDYRGYVRGRRPYESMIKPNATLADPRRRKSLFSTIYNKIKGKKKIKKVGSSLPESGIDPNQANQGAGFGMRNQTPPKRKMQAKLGDGTYDYSS